MNPAQEDPLASLLYPLMRLEGVHVYEGFPCFLTTAHSAADIDLIVAAFETALDHLQRAGILVGSNPVAASERLRPWRPPSAATLPDRVPLTEPQQEVYLAAQLGDAASTAFNELVSVRLAGEIDHDALTLALNDIVARHDALRGRFGDTGEMMDVVPSLTVALPLVDLSGAPDAEAALAQRLAVDAALPFDLAQGPLVRAQLVRLSAQSYRVCADCASHHLRWLVDQCHPDRIGRCLCCSASRFTGRHSRPRCLSGNMRLTCRRGPPSAATDAFWADMYKTLPAPLDLPSDRARASTLSLAWRVLQRVH